MKVFMALLLLTVFLFYTEGVHECGDRCRDGEMCLDNGTCVDPSDLVSCVLGYCEKGHACCGNGCIPEGYVCCNDYFCPSMHECCGIFTCCLPERYCYNDSCVIGEQQTTSTISTTATTRKVQTTPKHLTTKTESFTTGYVPRTISTTSLDRKTSSGKSSFLWWHGLLIAVMIIMGMANCAIFGKRFIKHIIAHASGGRVPGLNQPQVVYDNPVMASNPDMPQYHPQTEHFGAGTTSANGVTVVPNMQQPLMLTKTAVPAYKIKEKSPAVVDKNANIREHVTIPVNNMHQTNIHIAARPQTFSRPYAYIKKEKTKKEPSVKYLPYL